VPFGTLASKNPQKTRFLELVNPFFPPGNPVSRPGKANFLARKLEKPFEKLNFRPRKISSLARKTNFPARKINFRPRKIIFLPRKTHFPMEKPTFPFGKTEVPNGKKRLSVPSLQTHGRAGGGGVEF
jgi:hypothetical protein